MKKAYCYLLTLVTCCFVSVSCRNAAEDPYYDRPDWLEDPIYTILQDRGNFGLYLQCVDRTAYASVLKAAGLYTVFAPTDEAFKTWMSANGYSSVEAIPDQVVKDLVAYSMVYSKWPSDKFAYRFVNKEYELGAFKRKTACYALPHRDSEFGNTWVVDETTEGGLSYTQSDYVLNLTKQNYKYLPIFTQEFLDANSPVLTTRDYNEFFPDSEFTGLNVQAGTILEKDIYAENGLIQVVSTVNMPMDNIETILQDEEYEAYYGLLTAKENDEFLFRSYQNVNELNSNLLETYQTMMPDSFTELYVKEYSTDLGFSPLLETIWSTEGNEESERSGNTVFVPNNDTLEKYINDRLCKYYTREELPSSVLQTLINTHMANGMIWPTLYSESFNTSGEYLNGFGRQGKQFDDAGILSSQMASNGLVYQIDNVIKSRYFETVYSEVFLNPGDRYLNLAFDNSFADLKAQLLRCPLNGYISERWTLLNLTDELLEADGFGYDNVNAAFTHTEATASTRLQRLINNHIFPGIENGTVSSTVTGFESSPMGEKVYGGWGYLITNNGEMIRYKNNKLQAAGNIEDNTYCEVELVEDEFNNGYVFNIKGMLQYSPVKTNDTYKYSDLPLWTYIERAGAQNSNVTQFVAYVKACLMNADGGLDGIKEDQYYTVLMPGNSAINSAIKAKVLPTLAEITVDVDGSTDPEGAAAKAEALAKGQQFVNAHILVGQVIADDGYDYIYPASEMSPYETTLPTLLKITEEAYDMTNATTQVHVYKVDGKLRFEPLDIYQGNTLAVDGIVGTGATAFINGVNRGVAYKNATDNFRSNRIAGKAVLHEVSNFLHFDVQ